MKKISFLLFLNITVYSYIYAQNISLTKGNVGIYTSPPVAPFQEKASAGLVPPFVPSLRGIAALSLINGSFEFNTGICIINGSNETITSNVIATSAYGCAREIDLMKNTCGYGTAISGQYFLSLANGQGTCGDACNLELNANLIAGNTYTISYFDRGYDKDGCCPPGVALEVGISTNATSQGTIVYTSPVPTTNIWSQRTFVFVAPYSGKYISFHAKDNAGRWTHIDSVTISDAACVAPYNLQVPKVDSTAAKLRWSLPSAAVHSFKIFYRIKGAETIWYERKAGTEAQIRLWGLSPKTIYEWGMRSICDSSKSVVVAGPDFTTLPSGDIANDIKIFPNPVRNSIQIDGLSPTQKAKLSIADFLGNIKLAIIITGKFYTWNVSTLKPGNYILKIEANNTVASRWFVKE